MPKCECNAVNTIQPIKKIETTHKSDWEYNKRIEMISITVKNNRES